MSRSHEWPIGVRSVDVARPLIPLTGLRAYSRVRVFVSRGDDLIGSVDIWHRGADTISVQRLRDEIAGRLSEVLLRRELEERLAAGLEGARPAQHAETVSIIVPACDRAQVRQDSSSRSKCGNP